MTPMEAIKAGTITAAECLEIDDCVGSIEVGKVADMIIVDGDPLKNISMLRDRNNIKHVIKDGKNIPISKRIL